MTPATLHDVDSVTDCRAVVASILAVAVLRLHRQRAREAAGDIEVPPDPGLDKCGKFCPCESPRVDALPLGEAGRHDTREGDRA